MPRHAARRARRVALAGGRSHAGEQIFGVSRYTDELDPTDNDLDSIHTFSAQMPDRDRIHPDWVGKLSATKCSKHLHGLSGDGILVFQQTKKGDYSEAPPQPCALTTTIILPSPCRTSLDRVNHTTKRVIRMMTAVSLLGQQWSSLD